MITNPNRPSNPDKIKDRDLESTLEAFKNKFKEKLRNLDAFKNIKSQDDINNFDKDALYNDPEYLNILKSKTISKISRHILNKIVEEVDPTSPPYIELIKGKDKIEKKYSESIAEKIKEAIKDILKDIEKNLPTQSAQPAASSAPAVQLPATPQPPAATPPATPTGPKPPTQPTQQPSITPIPEDYDQGQVYTEKENGKLYTFPNGNTYIGTWEDGKMHGRGTLTYPNGDKYDGEFKEDIPHGQGTLILSNGDKYEGEFKEGAAHGRGIMTYPDGSQEELEYKHGKLISRTPINQKPSEQLEEDAEDEPDEEEEINELKTELTELIITDIKDKIASGNLELGKNDDENKDLLVKHIDKLKEKSSDEDLIKALNELFAILKDDQVKLVNIINEIIEKILLTDTIQPKDTEPKKKNKKKPKKKPSTKTDVDKDKGKNRNKAEQLEKDLQELENKFKNDIETYVLEWIKNYDKEIHKLRNQKRVDEVLTYIESKVKEGGKDPLDPIKKYFEEHQLNAQELLQFVQKAVSDLLSRNDIRNKMNEKISNERLENNTKLIHEFLEKAPQELDMNAIKELIEALLHTPGKRTGGIHYEVKGKKKKKEKRTIRPIALIKLKKFIENEQYDELLLNDYLIYLGRGHQELEKKIQRIASHVILEKQSSRESDADKKDTEPKSGFELQLVGFKSGLIKHILTVGIAMGELKKGKMKENKDLLFNEHEYLRRLVEQHVNHKINIEKVDVKGTLNDIKCRFNEIKKEAREQFQEAVLKYLNELFDEVSQEKITELEKAIIEKNPWTYIKIEENGKYNLAALDGAVNKVLIYNPKDQKGKKGKNIKTILKKIGILNDRGTTERSKDLRELIKKIILENNPNNPQSKKKDEDRGVDQNNSGEVNKDSSQAPSQETGPGQASPKPTSKPENNTSPNKKETGENSVEKNLSSRSLEDKEYENTDELFKFLQEMADNEGKIFYHSRKRSFSLTDAETLKDAIDAKGELSEEKIKELVTDKGIPKYVYEKFKTIAQPASKLSAFTRQDPKPITGASTTEAPDRNTPPPPPPPPPPPNPDDKPSDTPDKPTTETRPKKPTVLTDENFQELSKDIKTQDELFTLLEDISEEKEVMTKTGRQTTRVVSYEEKIPGKDNRTIPPHFILNTLKKLVDATRDSLDNKDEYRFNATAFRNESIPNYIFKKLIELPNQDSPTEQISKEDLDRLDTFLRGRITTKKVLKALLEMSSDKIPKITKGDNNTLVDFFFLKENATNNKALGEKLGLNDDLDVNIEDEQTELFHDIWEEREEAIFREILEKIALNFSKTLKQKVKQDQDIAQALEEFLTNPDIELNKEMPKKQIKDMIKGSNEIKTALNALLTSLDTDGGILISKELKDELMEEAIEENLLNQAMKYIKDNF